MTRTGAADLARGIAIELCREGELSSRSLRASKPWTSKGIPSH